MLPALVIAGALSAAPSSSCEALSGLELDAARIERAVAVEGGAFLADGLEAPIVDLRPFCRVSIVATPTYDSHVGIELWMPLTGWNGRLLGTGGGGYAGSVSYAGLAAGLAEGYASVTTDMGTSPASGSSGAPHLVGHPERWSDFGWRSTHLMTVLAKTVVSAFYGRGPDYSYFSGCSTGGMQGLREAQQFPEDYDGVLAGSPGSNRARIHVAILWNYAAAQREPGAALSTEQLELVHRSVLESCGLETGAVADDPFLLDPRTCEWSPDALRCEDASRSKGGCLSEAQLETVEALYRGPSNPRTGESIFPGLARGSELGWSEYMSVEPGEMPWRGVFEWVFGPGWDWTTFDYDQDMTTFETVLDPFFVATSPDLSRFWAGGGKLLLYNGWADWLSATEDTIDYYDAVVEDVSEREGLDPEDALGSTERFARLFLLPGMSHCRGGAGPDAFDGLGALTAWVERGEAPERLTATKTGDGAETKRRPICSYPLVARYQGAGDPDDPASFRCLAPE